MEIRRGRPFAGNSFRTPAKRPVVGVMGGSTVQDEAPVLALGAWLGRTGYDLLTGGGKGTMALVSRAYAEQPGRGLVLGVLPGMLLDGDPVYQTRSKAYPNPWVEVAIFTHLPTVEDLAGLPSRNPINILSSDLVVILPGGRGTHAELSLAMKLCKPVVAFLGAEGRVGGLDGPALADSFGAGLTVAGQLEDAARFIADTMTGLGYAPPRKES